jgi:hypothetical protein
MMLFFIAGALAGILGMHALGLRASNPAPQPATLRNQNLGNLQPQAQPQRSASANQLLERGLALGQMYERFARETEEPNASAPLPTIPAYNASAPTPPPEPMGEEPLQPLQPIGESANMRTARGAPVYTIPPLMRDALQAADQSQPR